MDKKITIDDLKSMLRGEHLKPVMHVRDEQDPLYISIRHIVKEVDPDAEDYMHSINARFTRMLESMSSMEAHDISRIIKTFKKYEIKGDGMGGVSGKRMYGYDKSRIDRTLIRRRRPN
tara:strand:+ start:114 stop:467 length:354 start_codon:yes stop_codon:yes gene_type:complete